MAWNDFLLGLGSVATGVGALGSAFNAGSNRNAPSGNTVFWTNRADTLRNIDQERARQDDFIRRRVADARAAGLHPLFALGAQAPPGLMPSSTGYAPETSGTDWASMGWGVGSMMRGAAVMRRAQERQLKEQVKNTKADTAVKKAEAAKENALAANIKKQGALTGPPLQPGVVPQVVPTVPASPVEPAVDWKDQLMQSRGPVWIQEWDDLVFSDLAEIIRDAIRARSTINHFADDYFERLPLRKRVPRGREILKRKPHPAHSPKIWRKSWR